MRDIINKFVGMNAETRARTITAFIIAVADALSVFGVISFSDAQLDAIKNLVLLVVTGFVWAYCSHYKNNDYTEGAVRGTGITRQINNERKEGYTGERFYTNQVGDLLDNEADYDVEDVDGDVMACEQMAAEAAIAEDEKEN